MESSTIKRWTEEKESTNIWTKTWVDRKVNIYKLYYFEIICKYKFI